MCLLYYTFNHYFRVYSHLKKKFPVKQYAVLHMPAAASSISCLPHLLTVSFALVLDFTLGLFCTVTRCPRL